VTVPTNGHAPGHSNGHAASQSPDGPAADRRLVDRCLSGEREAWRELFGQQHHHLLASIRRMFGPAANDVNQVEEIAARVWFALFAEQGRLLDQFDVRQSCRLSTYLSALARTTAIEMFRSDKRRRRREAAVSRLEGQACEPVQYACLWRGEFLDFLTPREREYFNILLLNTWVLNCLYCFSYEG
jgi:DNA-directed RNA polymerase specialized sigma24 family protein